MKLKCFRMTFEFLELLTFNETQEFKSPIVKHFSSKKNAFVSSDKFAFYLGGA